jgi:two-component system chemotaxis sensor kinase CheA
MLERRVAGMIQDQALLSEYLSEADELLEKLLVNLDLLDANHADPDPALVNRIFRSVHSLKGLSGMMGLGELQELAHEFEDLLDDLRLGHLRLDASSCAGLQEAGAGLAALMGSAARGTADEEDFERMRELLAGIASRTREGVRERHDVSATLILSEQETKLLTDYERHRISENLIAERSFFAIAVEVEIEKLDKDYGVLSSRLSDKGELITTLPGDEAATSGVSLKLVFATKLKESQVKSLVSDFKGKVTRLGPSGWRKAGERLRVVGRKRSAASAILPPGFADESLRQLSPSVRVDMNQIDELSGLAHELSIQTEKLARMAGVFLAAGNLGSMEGIELRFTARRIEREFVELEERLVALRMVSLAQTFTRAARLGGRLARQLGKSVTVETTGRETQVDKVIVDRVADSLYHMLRNAIDHGIETPDERKLAGKKARGRIKIEATLEGARAVISMTDDGRGIDPAAVRRRAVEAGLITESEDLGPQETLRLIFRPGFSTADHVSAVSGRGVGLDAVERTIHALGGEVQIASEVGKWTRFDVAVPTTLVMISAFIVRSGQWRYAVNVNQIIELSYTASEEVVGRDGRRSIIWRGETVPLVELRYLLGFGGARILLPHGASEGGETASNGSGRVPLLITRAADRTVAVAVEGFDKHKEIIVKSLGSTGDKIKGVVGAVDLEGGEVALVIDLPTLLIRRSLRA